MITGFYFNIRKYPQNAKWGEQIGNRRILREEKGEDIQENGMETD
jgi:hypothetical protein